jgi:hypothetical protein
MVFIVLIPLLVSEFSFQHGGHRKDRFASKNTFFWCKSVIFCAFDCDITKFIRNFARIFRKNKIKNEKTIKEK